jgi:hypothetical protein
MNFNAEDPLVADLEQAIPCSTNTRPTNEKQCNKKPTAWY